MKKKSTFFNANGQLIYKRLDFTSRLFRSPAKEPPWVLLPTSPLVGGTSPEYQLLNLSLDTRHSLRVPAVDHSMGTLINICASHRTFLMLSSRSHQCLCDLFSGPKRARRVFLHCQALAPPRHGGGDVTGCAEPTEKTLFMLAPS